MSTSLSPPLHDISTAISPPPPTTNSTSSVTFITLILIFSTVVLIFVYLFLRYLSNRSNAMLTEHPRGVVSARTSDQSNVQVVHLANSSNNSSLLESLPLFDLGSVKGNLTGGDCAVCLSKFEVTDQLRLLPLCCHAFHAECIDTWIVSNQTCPLCRSSVFPSETDKIRKPGNRSFRIEIGSVSRREVVTEPTQLQSYSLGSFEYIVNGNGNEVLLESRGVSDDYKEPSIGVPVLDPRDEVLAGEVGGGGRGWMRDYFDIMASFSSRATSYRGSGRFFYGGSRRNGHAVEDLEANHTGEEIAEMFRWLSGI